MRPRAEINATTGHFDGSAINNTPMPPLQPGSIDRRLQVHVSDLVEEKQGVVAVRANARFFIEGQYIHPEDAEAGHGNNNVAYIEVKVELLANGNFALTTVGKTVRRPAIKAWEGAEFVNADAPEAVIGNRAIASRVIVAFKVTQLDRFKHRYEYAVYNMNSDRGIRSFSVPTLTDKITNPGFHAVSSHGQPWSNELWPPPRIEGGLVTWSIKTQTEAPNANAIRWGTMYNFYFDAEAAPVEGNAKLLRFQAGPGPEELSVPVEGPAHSPPQ